MTILGDGKEKQGLLRIFVVFVWGGKERGCYFITAIMAYGKTLLTATAIALGKSIILAQTDSFMHSLLLPSMPLGG